MLTELNHKYKSVKSKPIYLVKKNFSALRTTENQNYQMTFIKQQRFA
jgi:hypothetical protein